MENQDWFALCESIWNGNCVLFIGSEFPIVKKDAQGNEMLTNYQNILSAVLSNAIPGSDEQEDMPQLATRYFEDQRKTQQNFKFSILDNIQPWNSFDSPVFIELMKLKFPLIVDTNYTQLFSRLANDDRRQQGAYNIDGGQAVKVISNEGKEFFDFFRPYTYRLFGDIDKDNRIIISESDLLRFLVNVPGKVPLPLDIANQLKGVNKSFLFIGFGFLRRDWYFRVLFHTLKNVSTDSPLSFVIQDGPIVSNGAHNYFRKSLNTIVIQQDTAEFVTKLSQKFTEFETRKNESDDYRYKKAPRCFISYKRQDQAIVQRIYDYLRAEGVDVWIDKEALRGRFDQEIMEEIERTNCFLLMQSKALKESSNTYVHKEIELAADIRGVAFESGTTNRAIKSGSIDSLSNFIYPCLLDGMEHQHSAVYPFINELQQFELVRDGDLNIAELKKLAKAIREQKLR